MSTLNAISQGTRARLANLAVPRELQPGMRFNHRYTLIKRIAKSGMAEIWLAAEGQERLQALKIVDRTVRDFDLGLQKEVVNLKEFYNHRETMFPKVNDYDLVGENRYFAMDYIDGMTLRALIGKKDNPRRFIPFPKALEIGMTVLGGLRMIKGHQKVHRDLKPENIMITPDKIWLLDFGITCPVGHQNEDPSSVVGTPHYMSPDQVNNMPIDHRSDIYSLGLILYEMVHRSNPMTGSNYLDVAFNQRNKPVPEIDRETIQDRFAIHLKKGILSRIRDYFLGRKVKKLYAALNDLVQGMTRKDREERFSDIDQIIAKMERAKTIAKKLAKYEIF